MTDVAVLDDVVSALNAELAGLFTRGLAPEDV